MKIKLFLFALVLFTSCSSEEIETEIELANVEVAVIFFNHEVNFGDQTELVEFNIKFSNKSAFDIEGAPRITYRRMDNPDITSTRSYNLDELPCTLLDSGAECTFSYKNVENYNPELYGPDGPSELQIAEVEYIITEEFR